MTIEDEGIEPDIEFGRGKMKEKKNVAKTKSNHCHDKFADSGRESLEKDKVTSGNVLNSETLVHSKKQLKRRHSLGPEQNELSEEADVLKKMNKKFGELSRRAAQPDTPLMTQKKKKKLVKKKLIEGMAVEEVTRKSLRDLIESKPAEPQNPDANERKDALKSKKKKKEERAVNMPSEAGVPPKKLVQSSSEPPVMVAEDGDSGKEQDWKLFDPEKKKKKKAKKKIVVEEKNKESKEIMGAGKTKKKKKKFKIISELAANSDGPTEGNKQDPAPHVQDLGKYKELLERLASIKREGEARQMITPEVAAGKIEESEVMTVLRLWRQQKRRKMQAENKDKLIQMDGTLEELKNVVNTLVRKGKLKPKDAGDIIRRWKLREKRRVERQVSKQTNRSCFHCRQQGHVLADCPNRGEDSREVGNMVTLHGDGICFKCGSTEHNVHKCPRRNVKGFPFATCFVCGQQGHLSRDCEKNANGIYPDGGGCNVCGSPRHLKRDCPELAARKLKKDERKVTIRTMSVMSSADADDIPDEEPKEEKKKPRKIVRF